MNTALTSPDPIADIQFSDHYLPPLTVGTYTIAFTHEAKDADNPTNLDENFSTSQQFSVIAPRFTLDKTEIQSQFPADKSQGQYDQQLPYIVLTKRALPWERILDASDPTIPWLALVIFKEGEILTGNSNNGASLSNLTQTQTLPLSQIIQPEAGVLGPAIQLEPLDDPTQTYEAIDIAPATFTALVPRLTELKYLAHCREIDLASKCESQLAGNGWFSVIMANRLPTAPMEGDPPLPHIAHLVSLEGFQSYLGDNPSFPAQINKIRLFSLASWTFNTLSEPKENFASLLSNFIANQAVGGQGLLLRQPTTGTTTNPDGSLVQQILSHGYVPLSYQTRSGDRTYAWYRSPLTPQPIAEFSTIPAYPAAEAAMIYDATTGLFDQSYAIAWQTGRLLALADRSFAISLLNWRRQTIQAVQLVQSRLASPRVESSLKQTETVDQIRQLLHPKRVSRGIMDFMAQEFADTVAPHVASLGYREHSPVAVAPAPKPTPHHPIEAWRSFIVQPDVAHQFTRLLQANKLALGAVATNSPTDTIPDNILAWFNNLALLYGVPFNNLVPSEAMLPKESIRFFYVDPNAIDAMIDGALSLGVQSSQESGFNQLVKMPLKQAIYHSISTVRSQLLGNTTPVPVTEAIAGFLVRSQIVSGYPGIEINCYGTTDGKNPSNPLQPLRMEQLNKDVLLCLLPTMPAWIEFNQPKEGIGFGVEEGNLIYLRTVKTGGSSLPGSILQPELQQTIPFRGTDTVLDIQTLQTQIQQKLQGQLNNPDNIISPAEFVIQLLRAPEKMVFQNPTSS